MTSCFDMIIQVSPSRESHGRRLVRASTPTAVPHNETRASKPGCTVGANLQNAVQHLRIQLGHTKGDKSTSSFQGQLAVRRVSSGGGDRSRWGSTDSTEVAKTIHRAKTQKLFTQKLLDPKATPLATLTPRPNPSLSLTTEKLLNRKATLPTACYRPMSSPGPGGTVHVPHLGVFIAAYAPRQFHQVSSPRVGGCGVPCSRLSQCGNSEPPPPTPPLCPPTPPLLRVVGMPFPALRRL